MLERVLSLEKQLLVSLNYMIHQTVNGISHFRIFKLVRVCSLVGRYFYNVYRVNRLKLCFP